MKPRFLLVAALVVAIPVVLLILRAIYPGSPEVSPTLAPPSGTAKEQAERVGGPAEVNARLAATPEADESSIVAEGSGATLLQSHCAQCHSVKLLERTRKSRTEWEKILSRMERYSGPLSGTEKRLVLDHLAASEGR